MQPVRPYTTQLQAGLGMVPETRSLLHLWEPGDSPTVLTAKAVASGLFSRATARRTRNVVMEMFAPRLLTHDGEPAERLKFLTENRMPAESVTQLLFLYTTRAQAIFHDFVTDVFWPRYCTGATTLSRADAERFVHRALDSGQMKQRWTPATIRRISAYLLGCAADFGLLGGHRGQERAIKPFSIREDVAVYLAYDLHFCQLSDMTVVSHPDWHLFGLETADVIRQMKQMSAQGHLLIQAAPDLVQISWAYRKMVDCLHALA